MILLKKYKAYIIMIEEYTALGQTSSFELWNQIVKRSKQNGLIKIIISTTRNSQIIFQSSMFDDQANQINHRKAA